MFEKLILNFFIGLTVWDIEHKIDTRSACMSIIELQFKVSCDAAYKSAKHAREIIVFSEQEGEKLLSERNYVAAASKFQYGLALLEQCYRLPNTFDHSSTRVMLARKSEEQGEISRAAHLFQNALASRRNQFDRKIEALYAACLSVQ